MDIYVFLLLLIICSCIGVIGVIGGFGGGVFIVPILILVFVYPIEEAVANSLVALFLPSILATFRNYRRKEVNFKLGLIFEIPTAIGAFIGANLTVILPSDLFKIIFGLIASLMAIFMLKDYRAQDLPSKTRGKWIKQLLQIGPQLTSNTDGESYRVSFFTLALTGLFIGVSAGMLGIGGGWIKTPLMILGFGIPPHIATATATFMIVITSAVGGITHILFGHVTILFIPLTIGLLIGSEIGSRIRPRIRSEQISLVVIISLFIIGFIMIGPILIT